MTFALLILEPEYRSRRRATAFVAAESPLSYGCRRRPAI